MEKPVNSTLLNVCIIPSRQVSKDCVKLSASLGRDTTIFLLGDGKFAHMTVYMARFADDKVVDVVAATEHVLRSVNPFRCEHGGYFLTEGRYLEVSYRRSAVLMSLHNSLIEQLAPLRINPGNPYEEGYFAPYTTEQGRNAEETGYDLAHDLYRPHITLTRYKEGMAPDKFPALPEVMLSFDLTKVCVYEADDNGAVCTLLKEFLIPLQ
jgi:hypothetical protein